jgi:hypothetical protein
VSNRLRPIPDGLSLCGYCGATEAWYWDNDNFLPTADRGGWVRFALALNPDPNADPHAADCPERAPWF